MQIILFTKIFLNCTPREVGAALVDLGVDGLDLAIRAGQCVEPASITTSLPEAMKIWGDQGLTVPMVTLEGHFTDPDAPGVETIYEACSKAGIGLLKLGYWAWKPGEDYWAGFDKVRASLEGFARLGEKYGVCSLVHTHAGNLYGSNASGVMMLLRDLDPRHVAAYLDPAHLALEGEPMELAMAMAGPHFAMVGVKNVRYLPPAGEGEDWIVDWCPMDEGIVNWPKVVGLLQNSGYGNPMSFHPEANYIRSLSVHATYSAFRDKEGAARLVKKDLDYLRSLLG